MLPFESQKCACSLPHHLSFYAPSSPSPVVHRFQIGRAQLQQWHGDAIVLDSSLSGDSALQFIVPDGSACKPACRCWLFQWLEVECIFQAVSWTQFLVEVEKLNKAPFWVCWVVEQSWVLVFARQICFLRCPQHTQDMDIGLVFHAE